MGQKLIQLHTEERTLDFSWLEKYWNDHIPNLLEATTPDSHHRARQCLLMYITAWMDEFARQRTWQGSKSAEINKLSVSSLIDRLGPTGYVWLVTAEVHTAKTCRSQRGLRLEASVSCLQPSDWWNVWSSACTTSYGLQGRTRYGAQSLAGCYEFWSSLVPRLYTFICWIDNWNNRLLLPTGTALSLTLEILCDCMISGIWVVKRGKLRHTNTIQGLAYTKQMLFGAQMKDKIGVPVLTLVHWPSWPVYVKTSDSW